MSVQLRSYPLACPADKTLESVILDLVAYHTKMNWGKAPIGIRVNAAAFPDGAPAQIGGLPVEVTCMAQPGWLELVEQVY